MARLFTAAALAALIAGPAAAQVVGTYSGTSADGNSVSFDVGTDATTGKLAIVNYTVFFSALCSDGSTFSSGWGIGLTQDVMHHTVKIVTPNPYFTFTIDLTFAGDNQSATGDITSISPTLSPVGPKPKKALFCTAPSQPLGVTLQSGAARVSPPSNGAMINYKAPAR